RRRFGIVHGHPHQLRSGAPELGNLLDGTRDVGGVGIGHGLHDDRRAPAHDHLADPHRARAPARLRYRFTHAATPSTPSDASTTRSRRNGRSTASSPALTSASSPATRSSLAGRTP